MRVASPGVVQSQQQIYAKQVGWCRGGSQFFGRNYLWRRMKTAHLIGFASLFLASEERAAEDSAYKIKLQEYEAMFHHIQVVFVSFLPVEISIYIKCFTFRTCLLRIEMIAESISKIRISAIPCQIMRWENVLRPVAMGLCMKQRYVEKG